MKAVRSYNLHFIEDEIETRRKSDGYKSSLIKSSPSEVVDNTKMKIGSQTSLRGSCQKINNIWRHEAHERVTKQVVPMQMY